MKTPSAEHAAAIARAGQYLEGTGLRVLDRDWHYGDGRLDVIATDAQHVLVVCVVRTMRRGGR